MFSTYKRMAAAVLAAASTTATMAQEYFDVVTMECRENRDGREYKASVDFPVGGSEAVMRAAKQWIGDILELDGVEDATADGFRTALDTAAKTWQNEVQGGNRTVSITWLYEDPSCVTFESVVSDRDSISWTTSDIATFSKRDGHRITSQETFRCDERQIKRLMWQSRGTLPMEVSNADALYVGDVGFIDGWVIVIGPARNTSGAEFRIRYSDAEQWLNEGREGYVP